ncbi:MAG: Flp family type IVb pilin [Chloroflexi bacterium]|nr:Flp family type IVb pilin [Chloroflexota bacterium]
MRAANALNGQRGQGLVEYALIIAVVAIMLVGALIGLRLGLIEAYNNIQNGLVNHP